MNTMRILQAAGLALALGLAPALTLAQSGGGGGGSSGGGRSGGGLGGGGGLSGGSGRLGGGGVGGSDLGGGGLDGSAPGATDAGRRISRGLGNDDLGRGLTGDAADARDTNDRLYQPNAARDGDEVGTGDGLGIDGFGGNGSSAGGGVRRPLGATTDGAGGERPGGGTIVPDSSPNALGAAGVRGIDTGVNGLSSSTFGNDRLRDTAPGVDAQRGTTVGSRSAANNSGIGDDVGGVARRPGTSSGSGGGAIGGGSAVGGGASGSAGSGLGFNTGTRGSSLLGSRDTIAPGATRACAPGDTGC